VAQEDPNPLVAGNGVKQLREAGVTVTTGDGALDVLQTLAPFFKHITSGLPWVTAKWAMTLDGHIAAAGGDARWISNKAARVWAHQLRDEVDAIVVGIGTALQDDPHLTVRLDQSQQLGRSPRNKAPLRVVLDSTCKLPLSHYLCSDLTTTPTRLYTTHLANDERASRLRTIGVDLVAVDADPHGGVSVPEVLRHLGATGCVHILVEGGNRVLGSFFDANAVDEVAAVVAPIVTGGLRAPSAVGGSGVQHIAEAWRLDNTRVTCMGDNMLMRGTIHKTGVLP
jgi:diaminohydroxyphosphoribosylaminopyrimidine deaminase/5-amino-6-(5-phosphoribosylamino)uracil reductase